MRQTVSLVLPGLLLLGGCRALVRDAEVIEYQPGGPVVTTSAERDASYRLSAKQTTFSETDVPRGAPVGFREEPDGSIIAFAGERKWRVEPEKGRHVWLNTPKPTNAWERFLVGTRDKSERAFITLVMRIMSPFWIFE